jgi:hypothetical protein
MLTRLTLKIWHDRPRLSPVFWFCTVFVYLVASLAIASLLSPALDEVLLRQNAPEIIAIKLNYIRLPGICLCLAVFPFLLWRSRRYALNFVSFFTAGAAVIYIDDHMVLYEIIQYPKLPIIQLALFFQPLAIMALVWMTFELHFRAKNGY